MHVTHSKQGGKSHKRIKRKEYDETKKKAIAQVMDNITAEAKSIEMNAVTQVLEKHIGRKLEFCDIPKIERVATKSGYVLQYDGVALGEITRQNHVDHHEDMNYRVTFTPYE
tara:strand:- start:484 stop:819 length:336 start_codon:yes stop_codon:yes gene_type:complete